MTILKRFFDFYINSSIQVGLAVFGFSKIVALHFNKNFNFTWFYFVFFSTIVGYNFLKYNAVFTSRNHYFLKKYFSVFIVSMISFLLSIYFFICLKFEIKIGVLFCSFLVILYPFIRRFWYLKTVCVAICVTAFVFVPFYNFILDFFNGNGVVICEFFFMIKLFLFILASMMPFEIYDSQFDDKKLQTIPQKFGITATKVIGYFLILGFVLISIYWKENLEIDLFIAFLMLISIFFSNLSCSKYFCSFWVEIIPFFWWILLVFC